MLTSTCPTLLYPMNYYYYKGKGKNDLGSFVVEFQPFINFPFNRKGEELLLFVAIFFICDSFKKQERSNWLRYS